MNVTMKRQAHTLGAITAGLVVLFAVSVMVGKHFHRPAMSAAASQAPVNPVAAQAADQPTDPLVTRGACIRLWMMAPRELDALKLPSKSEVEAQSDGALREWLKNTNLAQASQTMSRAELVAAVMASMTVVGQRRGQIADAIHGYETTCSALWPAKDRIAAKWAATNLGWLFLPLIWTNV